MFELLVATKAGPVMLLTCGFRQGSTVISIPFEMAEVFDKHLGNVPPITMDAFTRSLSDGL